MNRRHTGNNRDGETAPTALLERHRRDIEALDRRILHLVCERLDLARQIGDLKQGCGVPLRNFMVENQVRERFERASEDLGLGSSLGRDLAMFLIEKAVEEQATLMDSVYNGDHLETVVAGGRGGMGAWVARFLHGQGHRVSVLDPGSSECPFPEVESNSPEVESADLVVVAVPMDATAEVLLEISATRPRGVVAEMCSLKQHLQPVVREVRASGMRLISFHPMFGPGVRMLSGRKIVFCSDAEEADLAVVRRLFEGTSAELVEMEVAEHDRRMGLVLGLTHLSNLAFARALACSRTTARDMVEVAGVTFEKQLTTSREVSGENPGLYFQIQALSPTTDEAARLLIDAVGEVTGAVARGDTTEFAEIMRECSEYLEDA